MVMISVLVSGLESELVEICQLERLMLSKIFCKEFEDEEITKYIL